MTWTDELTDVDLLKSIWTALRRMEGTLAVLPELARQPAPIVNVPPPDLTEVVEAVVGLKGGPTAPSAGDIAAAIAQVLAPPRPDASEEALRQVTEGLERLETVLRSTGRTNFGGASPSNLTVRGPLTDTELRATAVPVSVATITDRLPDLVGVWSYYAGTAGTVNVAAGGRVIGIAAHAGAIAGTVTIAGGSSIPVPANTSVAFSPQGNLVAPQIVLTNTDSYVVEVLT